MGKGLWSGWEGWSRLLGLGWGLDRTEVGNGRSVPAGGRGRCWGSEWWPGVRLVGGCWGQGPSGWKDLGTPGCSWAGDWHCPWVAGAAPVPPGTALSVMVISLISSCLLED